MEHLRYLLAAIVAITLITSIVSSVNPSYFAGLNAFADDNEEEDDKNDNSDSNNQEDDQHEDDEDDSVTNKEEQGDNDKLVETLGNHSKATIETDNDHIGLEVEIEDGDLEDNTFDVTFSCESPNVDKEFTNALEVEDGNGSFDTDIALSNGTYTGCEVEVGDLSATFSSFSIISEEDDEENDGENDNNTHGQGTQEHEKDRDHKESSELKTEDDGIEIKVEVQDINMTDGSYDAIFACEEPDFNVTLDNAFEVNDGEGKLEETIGLANGTYASCDLSVEGTVLASFDKFIVSEDTEDQDSQVEEKRHERRSHIVSTINGTMIHERHNKSNPASPGEYLPDWNYTLEAVGVANETDATVDMNLSVWKSNGAIILLDVIDGTVQVGNHTYTIKIGYALYSLNHDAMRVVALGVDDDGNISKLRLHGTAVNEDDEFPMESGSIDLTFEGSSGPMDNRFGDWELAVDGTVSAD
jgi:hypothetical protein